jgi:hypothetical protein
VRSCHRFDSPPPARATRISCVWIYPDADRNAVHRLVATPFRPVTSGGDLALKLHSVETSQAPPLSCQFADPVRFPGFSAIR